MAKKLFNGYYYKVQCHVKEQPANWALNGNQKAHNKE